METTFAIIKPNAMNKNVIGKITDKWESAGLTVAGMKMIHMSQEKAQEFYAEHKERPFFGELVEFMTSRPVVLLALKGENAVLKNREIMGATNPEEAEEGTIRKLFGDNVGENAVHGSDSTASAERELGLFFEKNEIF
jgi:nucleoside-diphosphate kinase